MAGARVVVHSFRAPVAYERALHWQRLAQNHLFEAAQVPQAPEMAAAAHLFLLEHPTCYTMGRTSSRAHILDPAVQVHQIERGGEVTYHGPGQLVGYLVCHLDKPPFRRDLHWLLRQTEQVLMDTAADFGVQASRRAGRSGVWVGDAKVGAVGYGVKRWTTLHGWSLNCTPQSLQGFGKIVPCGIPQTEGGVGCIHAPNVADVAQALLANFADVFQVRVETCGDSLALFESWTSAGEGEVCR
jgi:lipoyl(octanoyl) transferase